MRRQRSSGVSGSRGFNRAVATLLGAVLVVAVLLGLGADRRLSPAPAGAASASGPVEVVQRRTETSKTFRNPDGTLTTQLYSGPVNYRDSAGWKVARAREQGRLRMA